MFAKANIHDEHNPWASIISRAPFHPHAVLDIIPAVARPIWLTDEYAMRDLISVCRIQISLVIIAPNRLTLINIGASFMLDEINGVARRINP